MLLLAPRTPNGCEGVLDGVGDGTAGATIIPPSPTPRKLTSGSVQDRVDVVDLEVRDVVVVGIR